MRDSPHCKQKNCLMRHADGTCHDLQLCGGTDPDQPRCSWNQLGIANLVVVVGPLFPSGREVLMISVARILLMGYLFGNGMSILYSLAGGLLSFLVMLLLKHIKGFSITGVSIAGGVTHNVARSAWRLSWCRTANCSIICRRFSWPESSPEC